jgi:hypothetical protein
MNVERVEWRVFMTKMHSLHPNDIHIFNSIFKDKLKDHVNVVVFSQKG